MKHNIILPIIALLGWGVSSCTVKEEDFQVDQKPILHQLVITASTGNETKTSVADGGETVLWDAEEQIKVFYNGQSAVFASQNEEAVNVTDFLGDMEYADGDKLLALYPYREDAACINDTIITRLPSLQLGRAGSFSKNMNLAVAESRSPQMSFKNVGGGIRFTVQRDDITWVSIESIGKEPLSGKVKILMENDAPQIKEVVDSSSTIALYAPDQQPFQPGQWYYVVAIPGVVSKGVKLVFHTSDGLYGEAVSNKALTITRSRYLGKEEIDAAVSSWQYPEPEEEMVVQEQNIEVEIPAQAEKSYVSKLRVVNSYGEHPLNSSPSQVISRRKRSGASYTSNVYGSQYKFAGNGYLFQFLQDFENQMVMCCVSSPEEQEEVMTAETTAIGILMMSPELMSDDTNEFEATLNTLRGLDEFQDYVDQIDQRLTEAMEQGKAPDYSDIDPTPVIYALMRNTFENTTLSQQGLDVIPTRHQEDSVFYKVRNNFRRVIHVYSEREWRTGTNVASVKQEETTFTLSEIVDLLSGNVDKSKDPRLMGIKVSQNDYNEMVSTVQSFADPDKALRYPFPYIMVPESASYWKIVKGSWHWWDRDVKMVFENTSPELGEDLKSADCLNIYTYGMGGMEEGYFNNASDEEKLKIIAVYLHGTINDYIMPIVNLITGVKKAKKAFNYQDYHYDLRYGANNYPEWALLVKLYENLDKQEALRKIMAAKNEGEYWEACRFFIKFVGHQIMGNADSSDTKKDTYYNLLFKIWRKYSGVGATEAEFRDMLKQSWNRGSKIFNTYNVYSTTKKILEAGVDLGGFVYAYNQSEAINKFVVFRDDNPSVRPIYPVMGEAVEGDKITFAWDMFLGKTVALNGVEYDLKLFIPTDQGTVLRTVENIATTYYTLDLASLKVSNPNPTIRYQVLAHHPGSSGLGITQSDPVSILVCDWQGKLSAVDMGLSVKWSSSSVGASSIVEKGKYYAWGEKLPRLDFSWSSYTMRNADGSMSRYNATDKLRTLLPEDDIVHILQGENWRMPTMAEWKDLENQCDWYSIKDGDQVIAYSGISKRNGNILYLPVGGYKKGTEVISGQMPRYWSSSLTDGSDYKKARSLNEGQYNEYGNIRFGDDRFLGMQIRGVFDVAQQQTDVDNAIDLGLSVRWATSNLGAARASDPGNYYAWGELTQKTEYGWGNYTFGTAGSNEAMTRYNDTDGIQVLLPEDDVVHAVYKGNWRMPTMAEWDELRENCDWYEDKDGDELKGYSIVSKINGKQIYLPVTGYMDGTENKDGNRPRYWSSSITNGDLKFTARNLNDNQYNWRSDYRGDNRCWGMAVRGVYDDAESRITPSSIVDLGLSVKWAGSNLGATSFEQPGNYFSWGETSTKQDFGWDSYKWGPDYNVMTKYNSTDALSILQRGDDAAYQKLGGPYWRMPTIEEWDELRNNCDWVPCTINAQRGYRITSKVNGKSIFLPIAGYIDGQQARDGMRPRYWSSSFTNGDLHYTARNLNENQYNWRSDYRGDDRRLGMLVRAVYDDSDKQITPSDLVDLGLSVRWASCNLGASSCEMLGDYYSWGEIAPKQDFQWATYKWGTDYNDMKKYNSSDNLQYLLREDDAAYQKLGGPYWRMPTIEEWNELRDNCEWTPIVINNQRGYRITSPKTGKSIFLPYSGYYDGTQMRDGMRPRYWSSSFTNGDLHYTARNLNENQYNWRSDYRGDDRRLGMPIRAVYDDAMDKIDLTEGEFVDMGLSVDWARCNMGTSLPEEIGSYYAWGETAPKTSFTWENYKFGPSDNLTKYNSADNLKVLDREDDAVYKRYGGSYRIPRMQEWDELWNNCTIEEVKIRNRRGFLLTSNINGNKIFLPYSGYKRESQLYDGMRPRYWSSSHTNGDLLYTARNLNDNQYNWRSDYRGDDRYLGMPLRGVRAKYEQTVTDSELVDLGLSVKWASRNMGAVNPEDFGDYYAWGETGTKSEFNWTNYALTDNGNYDGINKYTESDGRMFLDWNDDVVHLKKEGSWRMPTMDEWNELIENCDWTETTLNGIRGFRITSRTNTNSIFIPIGGLMEDKQLKDGMRARYWSSSLTNGDLRYTARNLNENQYNWRSDYRGDDRRYGMLVRGIYDDYAENHLTEGTLIDMGLSVRWASCNVGTKVPENTGIYFGWGEIGSHTSYSWENYSWGSAGTSEAMTKYNAEDGKKKLEKIDDAAYRFLVNGTRMPTIEEWQELMDNTDKVIKIKNGHLGYILTSKINGNAIFLPIAGYRDGEQYKDGMRPRYWSSSLTNGDLLYKARNLNESQYNWRSDYRGDDRCWGMPVRGVMD